MGAVVGFGASFRTREREEDSNATPPMTTSRVEEGCVVFVAGAGTWLDAIF